MLVLVSFGTRSEGARLAVLRQPDQLGYHALLSPASSRCCRKAPVRSAQGRDRAELVRVPGADLGVALGPVRDRGARRALVFSTRGSSPRDGRGDRDVPRGGPLARAIETTRRALFRHATPNRPLGSGATTGFSAQEYWCSAPVRGHGSIQGDHELGASEIHSTAGTILCSYVVIGSVLFLWFTWRIIEGGRVAIIDVALPPLLYTFAHQDCIHPPLGDAADLRRIKESW